VRYSILAERFGTHETRRLIDTTSGAQVLIARRGATLLRWDAVLAGELRTISDGHQTPAELESQSGMRFGLMAPFSNRIADARYHFDGEEFDLQPGVAADKRGIRHGFVRHADFDIIEESVTERQASLKLSTRILRPEVFAGYPFAIDVSVTISLRGNGVEYSIEAINVGDRAAPYGCGLHPYFRLSDAGIETLALQIPARRLVLTDANLIPLPDEAAYAALAGHPELDFRKASAIDGRIIDQAYIDLEMEQDGRLRTRLFDPASGSCLVVSQTRGLLHAFTADTVARGRRAALALEPVELPTNAFNREDCRVAARLEPGKTRRFDCGFELING
jgi:aldose 1-epimerase